MNRRNAETPKHRNGAAHSNFRHFDLSILALAALHALLTLAIFPPLDFWPLAFLTPIPLVMVAWRARSTFAALLAVLLTQWPMWLWLLRWIMPVTSVGYPALALYQSTHAALLVWVLRRVTLSPRFARLPMTLLLPVIWTASEYFRGEIAFNGYPWYMLGQPLIHWLSFAQSSDLFGAYFISFLAAMPAGVALDACRAVPDRTDGRAFAASFIRPGAIAIVILIANVGYGQWRLHQEASLSPGPRILAIQTNLPQDNKIGWTIEQQAIDVPGFMQLTREAISKAGGRGNVDLIAWPETMVPSLGFEPTTRDDVRLFGERFAYLVRWVDAVEALSRDELRVPMLVGSEAWVGTSIENGADGLAHLVREKEYNSAFLIQDHPPYQRYDKAVLTPFGETMPYISNWPWLEQKLLALGAGGMEFNLDASPEVQILNLKVDGAAAAENRPARTFRLATPICFEDTVAWLCRRMAYAGGEKRADVFVNLSNDGWFGRSEADRRLHAQIARFRCIENRLPMVRCVNTGVSLHVDSNGRVVAQAGGTPSAGGGVINQPAWVLANVRIDARVTLFGRIGNAFSVVSLVLAVGMLFATFVRSRPSTADSGVIA